MRTLKLEFNSEKILNSDTTINCAKLLWFLQKKDEKNLWSEVLYKKNHFGRYYFTFFIFQSKEPEM